MTKLRLFRLGFWCLVGAVLILALAPAGELAPGLPFDKLNHMLAFFVLASLARVLWPGVGALRLLALLICFGGAIEILQWAMGVGREADWWDFAADVVATMAGLLFGRFLPAFRDRRAPAE